MALSRGDTHKRRRSSESFWLRATRNSTTSVTYVEAVSMRSNKAFTIAVIIKRTMLCFGTVFNCLSGNKMTSGLIDVSSLNPLAFTPAKSSQSRCSPPPFRLPPSPITHTRARTDTHVQPQTNKQTKNPPLSKKQNKTKNKHKKTTKNPKTKQNPKQKNSNKKQPPPPPQQQQMQES